MMKENNYNQWNEHYDYIKNSFGDINAKLVSEEIVLDLFEMQPHLVNKEKNLMSKMRMR